MEDTLRFPTRRVEFLQIFADARLEFTLLCFEFNKSSLCVSTRRKFCNNVRACRPLTGSCPQGITSCVRRFIKTKCVKEEAGHLLRAIWIDSSGDFVKFGGDLPKLDVCVDIFFPHPFRV